MTGYHSLSGYVAFIVSTPMQWFVTGTWYKTMSDGVEQDGHYAMDQASSISSN